MLLAAMLWLSEGGVLGLAKANRNEDAFGFLLFRDSKVFLGRLGPNQLLLEGPFRDLAASVNVS